MIDFVSGTSNMKQLMNLSKLVSISSLIPYEPKMFAR